MLYHCGLIYLPEYLHSSYHNPLHSMEGANRRMRWACAKMISFLGSCPKTHILFRYNVHGLPEHLYGYSKGFARINPSPPGQRSIDSRLASKPLTSRNSSRKEGRVSSTPKKTRATDTTVKATTEDPTPATEEDGEVAVMTVEAGTNGCSQCRSQA